MPQITTHRRCPSPARDSVGTSISCFSYWTRREPKTRSENIIKKTFLTISLRNTCSKGLSIWKIRRYIKPLVYFDTSYTAIWVHGARIAV